MVKSNDRVHKKMSHYNGAIVSIVIKLYKWYSKMNDYSQASDEYGVWMLFLKMLLMTNFVYFLELHQKSRIFVFIYF